MTQLIRHLVVGKPVMVITLAMYVDLHKNILANIIAG